MTKASKVINYTDLVFKPKKMLEDIESNKKLI